MTDFINASGSYRSPIEVKMYLGLSIPGGSRVYEAELREWLSGVVDPVFTGYSISVLEGVWNGDSEDSRVIEFICDSTEYCKAVVIARDYKATFRQEAVLLTFKELNGATLI